MLIELSPYVHDEATTPTANHMITVN